MRLLHWCMLGVGVLLLMCEVAISQLCKSLITLVDGFHTLFVLMRMALPLPQTAATPPLSSLDTPTPPPPPPPPLHALSSTEAAPLTLSAAGVGKLLPGRRIVAVSDELQSSSDAAAAGSDLHQPPSSAAPPDCALSFSRSRAQPVGVFLSALLLTSLCTSYLMEIFCFFLDPHPVQHALLPVLVGAVSLLFKMLLFGLNWDQLQARGGTGDRQQHCEAYVEVNHKVRAEDGSTGREDMGRTSPVKAADHSLHSGTLVLCNPETSSIPDNSMLHQVVRRAPSSQQPSGLLSFVSVIQGLFTSLLALISSLAMLLIAPQLPHSPAASHPLEYLDPALSLLAVITLIASTLPQVYRYGLLLLQAAPPHLCVADVGRRIASVPGVQAVHDLHVWQLTGSLLVASVHVHCYAGFPAHRCADMVSGVSAVLHGVGVNCCTVQPEFVSPDVSTGAAASPVIHREDPSPPPPLHCSLACKRGCSGSMCCALLEEEPLGSLAPPAGEAREEPQTLIIENTFL